MSERGMHSYKEIMSQPEILSKALDVFQNQADALITLWKSNSFEQVVFTGCGSTYHLSKSAAAIFQSMTGLPAFSCPGSEAVLFPEIVYPKCKSILLVAVSRSGETTETVEAVPVFRKETGGKVVAITCDSQSSLVRLADLTIAVDAAQEESVAQTRSFSTMLLLTQALGGLIAGKDTSLLSRVPEVVRRLLSEHEVLIKGLGSDKKIERVFFLGSGMLYGLASEAMLKMKEMSLSYSEAFHTLDIRHGPMSMVNGNSIVVGLLSESALKYEVEVMRDMYHLGARILSISEKSRPDLKSIGDLILLDSGLPDWARTLTYLPVLQLFGYYRSMSKGLNPDKPNNLNAVVHLSPMVSGE
jgi:glucosamine--fructose-6-phosphate aminotransferase (isomerizing)